VTEMHIRMEVEEAMPDLESEYVHGTIMRLLGLAHDHGNGVATRARGRR